MIIISYDISDDKTRTKFSKYLQQYGRRLQYSVYEIENSDRILKNIVLEITNNFEKRFTQADSVYIFNVDSKKVQRFGYAANEESELLFFG